MAFVARRIEKLAGYPKVTRILAVLLTLLLAPVGAIAQSSCSASCSDGSSCEIKEPKQPQLPPLESLTEQVTAVDAPVEIDTVVDIKGGVLHQSRNLAAEARRVLAVAATLERRDKALDGLLANLREALLGRNGSELQMSLVRLQEWQSVHNLPELATAFLKVSCSCSGPPGRMATCNY